MKKDIPLGEEGLTQDKEIIMSCVMVLYESYIQMFYKTDTQSKRNKANRDKQITNMSPTLRIMQDLRKKKYV